MISLIIMMLFTVDLCFFLLSGYWTCYFVLPLSGSSLKFHELWTLYLLWISLSAFPKLFFLFQLLYIVTLSVSLFSVMRSVFFLQLCWIFVVRLSVLIYLQIYYFSFCRSLFSTPYNFLRYCVYLLFHFFFL